MASEVLPDLPVENKPKKTLSERVTTVRKNLPSLIDALVLLTIAGWYFFFTGIAICLGRTIPKRWMNLSEAISKKKLAERITPPQEPVAPKVVHHRVVDLETRMPLN